MPRNATFHTTAVEVACPYCGEPQPSPSDGSHIWRADDVKKAADWHLYPDAANHTPTQCVSCGKEIRIKAWFAARVEY